MQTMANTCESYRSKVCCIKVYYIVDAAAQKTAQKVIDSHKKETSNLRPSGVSELIDRVFLCIFTCFWLSSTLSFGVVYFVCYVHAKRNHGFFAANADTRQL